MLNTFALAVDRAGGGGGGIYNPADGTIYTVAETGVSSSLPEVVTSNKQFKPRPTYYSIPLKVYDNYTEIMQNIRKIIPGFSFSRDFSFSPSKDQLVSKLDAKSEDFKEIYEKIKNEYRQVYEKLGQTFDSNNFVLTAYTENYVTYILPDFNKLSPMQQAKTLIHEANMRDAYLSTHTRLETLERALAIDSLIEQLAFPKQNSKLNTFGVLKQMAKLGMIDKNGVFQQILFMMYKDMNETFTTYDLVDLGLHFDNNHRVTQKTVKLDGSYIQEIQQQKELKFNYASLLNDSEVRFGSTDFYYDSKHPNVVNKYCSKNTSNNEIVKIIPDPFNLSLRHHSAEAPNLPIKGLVLAKCSTNWVGTYLTTIDLVLNKASQDITTISNDR